jgi:lipopolysaccharide/colanic/teichoic acid biosynthesis glycosyltransferase
MLYQRISGHGTGDLPLHTRHPGIGGLNACCKRSFDLLAAFAMLVLFAPIMAGVALAIRGRTGGPVLFAHRRIGKDGKPFDCLKFRTMVEDADAVLVRLLSEDAAAREEWALTRKLRCDPRIIPGVGSFLRRSSLDELPQILNVLRGEMSVVGPRPVVSEELEHYGIWAECYLSVRPGLTGPWQIGGRSDKSYEERVRLDVDYVERWSLMTDIRIFLRTAQVLVSSRGAY